MCVGGGGGGTKNHAAAAFEASIDPPTLDQLPFDLYPGQHKVHVYDIENDGTLQNGVGYPAATEELFTNNGSSSFIQYGWNRSLQPFNYTCTLNSASHLIWVDCTHPNNSFPAGIQVIVQSTNVIEVQKLYVNQSMDLRTPVTVPVERDGEYQVSIFTIRKGIGILGSMEYRTVAVIVNSSKHAAISTQGVAESSVFHYVTYNNELCAGDISRISSSLGVIIIAGHE